MCYRSKPVNPTPLRPINPFMKHHLLKSLLSLSLFILLLPAFSVAQPGNEKVLDQIVAIVNDNIILKSDVDAEVSNFIRQSKQPYSEELWYQALGSIIENYCYLEQARIDSIVVDDDRVDRAMDERIDMLVQQAGSEEALETSFGKSIVQIKADFRERFREDMIVQSFRQQKISSIKITRPEVKEYFKKIPQDSLPTVPERVEIAQIVAVPPPLEGARNSAIVLAEALRDSILNHGKSLEELARRHSDGPSAPNGGNLGMIQMNQLVSEYSAAASALRPGEISEVVETSYGFHIIRLDQRVSDRIATHHILIQVDKEQLDTDAAVAKLEAIRDSVINHDEEFSDLARRHSEDKATASLGGKLLNPQTGERLIQINSLDPSLYRVVLLLDQPGDVSQPKPFTSQQTGSKAYRIVQLIRRVPEHKANFEQDFDLIKRVALQEKQFSKLQGLLQDIMDDIYVEYKVNIPEKYKL